MYVVWPVTGSLSARGRHPEGRKPHQWVPSRGTRGSTRSPATPARARRPSHRAHAKNSALPYRQGSVHLSCAVGFVQCAMPVASSRGQRRACVPFRQRHPLGKLLLVAFEESVEPVLHALTMPIQRSASLCFGIRQHRSKFELRRHDRCSFAFSRRSLRRVNSRDSFRAIAAVAWCRLLYGPAQMLRPVGDTKNLPLSRLMVKPLKAKMRAFVSFFFKVHPPVLQCQRPGRALAESPE